MKPITKSPLSWPIGWKRTNARREGRFSSKGDNGYTRPLTISEATRRITDELSRMGVRDGDIIISTNLELRLDGLPRSGQSRPADPGVAVYWTKAKSMKCMAIDLYGKVEQNLAAVAASLAAMRAIERHGGAEVMDRTFAGFAALPESSTTRTWMDILSLPNDCGRDAIEARFRELAKTRHPDAGGSRAQWDELQEARKQAVAASW